MEDYRLVEFEEHHEQREHDDDAQHREEDDDEDEDEDYEDEYEEEDDDHDYGDEEDEDEEVEEFLPLSPLVSSSIADGRILEAAMGINDSLMDDSNELESCKKQESGGGDGGKEELNRGEIDGLFCPICLDTWTSGGDHQICCLPCGHIYGSSCIKKWLQLCRGSGKCPLCNSLCRLKDVRVLYATRLCVADEELHKRVQSLEAKCAYLEQKEIRPSDVPCTAHMTERLDHIELELHRLQEQQLQIKQRQQELQESIDQHRDYVLSCMEEMQHRQPHIPP